MIRNSIDTTVEKFDIIETIHRERIARDHADWAGLASFYHPDSRIEVSWIRGSGEDFVEGSRRQVESGLRGHHQIGITIVDIVGDKAIARTNCEITLLSPVTIAGVEVELRSLTRLHYRLARVEGRWLITYMTCVYAKDTVMPVVPGDFIEIDAALLRSFRKSYRYLSYMMREAGHAVADDLPGLDRPDTISKVEEADMLWLES